MNIVYSCSRDWLQYLPIQIYSIARHTPGPVNVYIIGKNFTEEDSTMLLSLNIPNFTIHLVDCQESFPHVITRFTEYTMFRLFIPKLIPDLNKCLYLDADTLVVHNLNELYNIPIDLLAGVIDKGITPKRKRAINFPEPYNYINAGVLLLNLEAIKTKGINTQWELMANTLYPCYDQDIINLTHNNQITVLDRSYNSSICTGISSKPKIIHYAGSKGRNWVHSLPQAKRWSEALSYYNKNKK